MNARHNPHRIAVFLAEQRHGPHFLCLRHRHGTFLLHHDIAPDLFIDDVLHHPDLLFGHAEVVADLVKQDFFHSLLDLPFCPAHRFDVFLIQ